MKCRNQYSIERVFARPAQTQARQRDADLSHRKQPPRIRQQIECGMRAGVSLFRHLAQPRRPHRKQRDLSAREKSIDRDQQNDQQNAQWGISHVRTRAAPLSDNNSIGDSLTNEGSPRLCW